MKRNWRLVRKPDCQAIVLLNLREVWAVGWMRVKNCILCFILSSMLLMAGYVAGYHAGRAADCNDGLETIQLETEYGRVWLVGSDASGFLDSVLPRG